MATFYEIRLIPFNQTLQVSLAGKLYTLTVRWNHPLQLWVMDIAAADGSATVNGIAMVTGCDLLGPYRYLGFAGTLLVQTDHDTDAPPAFDNLGLTSHLYFVADAA